jgi:glycosyltransferase involved in cell wall biosynthesis
MPGAVTGSAGGLRIAMIGSRGVGSHYGGIERMLDALCPELAACGHQVDVFGRVNVAFNDAVLPGGGSVRAVRTGAFGGKHGENISRSAHALWLAMGRYDVVHFHAIGPGILSTITRLFGQTSLVTIHGLDHQRAKWGAVAKRCLSLAERTLVANADGISVVSEPLRRYFDQVYGTATAFVPNGLNRGAKIPPGALLAEHGLQAGRYLLFASRLTPEKGCHDLIEAFNTLPTDMRLVVAGASGTPEYLAALRAAADPARVCFVGHRSGDELAELFCNAYAFILPSHLEGMSMALLEAVSFGVPGLVSDIEENRAVLGEEGFFFPPRNVPALRVALADLMASPEKVAEVAKRLATLNQPNWGEVAARYDSLYRAVCSKKGIAAAQAALAAVR